MEYSNEDLTKIILEHDKAITKLSFAIEKFVDSLDRIDKTMSENQVYFKKIYELESNHQEYIKIKPDILKRIESLELVHDNRGCRSMDSIANQLRECQLDLKDMQEKQEENDKFKREAFLTIIGFIIALIGIAAGVYFK